MEKSRRNFVKKGMLGMMLLPMKDLSVIPEVEEADTANVKRIISTTTVGNHTTVMVSGEQEPLKIMHITDSHITVPDKEGDAKVWDYCKRMHQAYESTGSHSSGENVSRPEAFRILVDIAKRRHVDLIVLSGDIVNFPSPATVHFVYDVLLDSGVPFVYISGNHDWHLEGEDGSDKMLREKNMPILKPLYQGSNPMYHSKIVKGINIVSIDNSTYQINREQLNFFKQQIKKGLPIVLSMHIPACTSMHSNCTMGYSKWGAAIDNSFEIERRERWSEKGNDPETVEFHKLLMETPNIVVLTGHVHTNRIERENQLFQIVTALSRDGHYRIIDFVGKKE